LNVLLKMASGAGHLSDHVTPAVPRGEGLQEGLLAVEHPNAGRPVHFMAGEHVEIGVQRLHIHWTGNRDFVSKKSEVLLAKLH
jgi:hypothetical protein